MYNTYTSMVYTMQTHSKDVPDKGKWHIAMYYSEVSHTKVVIITW